MLESRFWTARSVAAPGKYQRLLAVAVTTTLAATWLFAGVASAKSQTLRFYQVSGPTHFFNAAGHRIDLNPPAMLPSPGDSFDETDLDYAGTAKHHAKQWTMSDALTCKFTNADTGTCASVWATGNSLLISWSFTLHFQLASEVVPITEGTGTFSGVHGTFTDVDLPKSNDSILVIHLS
jgi:hypothetical protein